MRFGKNVLSQNLRTECDLALYLTLFRPAELEPKDLPTPLEARPGVDFLRSAGIEQETLIYNRLAAAFGDRCIGTRPAQASALWEDEPLIELLAQVADVPSVLIQPKFDVDDFRDETLVNLGVAADDLPLMPTFEGFIPDVVIIDRVRPHTCELTATGERVPVAHDDERLGLSIVDVKHAQEANPSYESEVALYGVVLANWLSHSGLADQYFVTVTLGLWTRAGASRGALQTAIDNGVQDPVILLDAVRSEVEPLNLPIYVQAIRRFFAERIPYIVRVGNENWRALDWHVNAKCASCDWLGYRGWLNPRDRAHADAHPLDYCFSRAEAVDHMSRLPLITRGSRRVLEASGLNSVAHLAATQGNEPVYTRHTRLKADRRAIPGYATAIATLTSAIDLERTDGTLARWCDLSIFININFDPGSGLLTGVGLQASFFQPFPYGQAPPDRQQRRWRERWIVTAKSTEAERSALLAFLQTLASVFEFATNTDPQRGGPHAADTTAQLVFWDRRQFEELCLGLGRHLPAILYDRQQDRMVRALAWLFPPEELQEQDNIDERRPSVAFARDSVRRLVRVPALHALTLFNVAEHYHYGDRPFQPPDNFYCEPLSDTIPRERIYEIWSLSAGGAAGTIRWGPVVKTFNQLTEGFSRTIDSQGFALSSITYKLRQDFGDRLRAHAPKIQLTVPAWATGVAHDSKLWIAWARFESAFGRASRYLFFATDPEEAEATHEAIRLTRVLGEAGDGTVLYEVSPESINAKMKAPSSFLCLSVDAVPGFLALPARTVLGYEAIPDELRLLASTPMHKLFGIVLSDFDRVEALARIRFSELFGQTAAQKRLLRDMIIDSLGEDFERNLTIVEGLGPDVHVRRLTKILRAIGNPPNATPAPETSIALGVADRIARPGTSAVKPAARVLWEGRTLNGERPREAVADAILAMGSTVVDLNESQADAVRAAAGGRLTIIWGPPGTGKTNTCTALIHGVTVHEAQHPQGPYAILLTGPNYKAVGELVERVSSVLAQDPNARCRMYNVFSEHRAERFPVVEPVPAHMEIFETPVDNWDGTFNQMLDDLNGGDRVVIVSAVVHQCAKLAENMDGLAQLFHLVLIDETSQVDMTNALAPLALLKMDFQLVVAGDHLQMPPIVLTDPPVGAEYLVGSFQRYLTERFNVALEPLLENYRSNEEIVAYTRRLGYPPELQAANPDTRITLRRPVTELQGLLGDAGLIWSDLWEGALDPSRPIVALTYPDGMAGQANEFEATCVATLVWLLRESGTSILSGRGQEADNEPWDEHGFWTHGVGIVTPHRAQRAQVILALQRAFPDTDRNLIESAVDTVERFQGGERQVIIISFGVGDPDVIRGEERFLLQLERTNVAISRAMGKCIVFMSDEVANHIPDDRKAAATAHALRGVVDEWCVNRLDGYVPTPDGLQRRMALRWH